MKRYKKDLTSSPIFIRDLINIDTDGFPFIIGDQMIFQCLECNEYILEVSDKIGVPTDYKINDLVFNLLTEFDKSQVYKQHFVCTYCVGIVEPV